MRRRLWLLTAAVLLGLAQGCASQTASPDPHALKITIEIPEIARHEPYNISDKPTLNVVFTNSSDHAVVLPTGAIIDDVNLFVVMSRKDPLPYIDDIKKGYRDHLMPFFNVTKEMILLHSGESYSIPPPTWGVTWATFIRGTLTGNDDRSGTWYIRAYFSGRYFPETIDAAAKQYPGVPLWREPVISPVQSIQFMRRQ